MNLRTRVKFCGITRDEDARSAIALGADAIGFVVTRKSKRYVEPARVATIRAILPPLVSVVVLLLDDDEATVEHVVQTVRPDAIQFHGSESRELCESFAIPYIKTIGMADEDAVKRVVDAHPNAAAYLLDSHRAGEQGGTGRAFDWSKVPRDFHKPIILAGGLTCDNVALAIRTARPFAVDVSSGIESAPGIKDAEKMRRFIEEVRRVGGES